MKENQSWHTKPALLIMYNLYSINYKINKKKDIFLFFGYCKSVSRSSMFGDKSFGIFCVGEIFKSVDSGFNRSLPVQNLEKRF